jgi:hypothetical protein
MSVAINGTNGITYNDGSLQPSAPVGKNLVINGDMIIDQRNGGASNTLVGTSTSHSTSAMMTDRWQLFLHGITNAQTYQQVTDAPVGFSHSLKITNNSTTQSVGAANALTPRQKIEGLNTAHLNWGTSDAQTITISFWVKASVTGTYPVSVGNSAFDRAYVSTYTVSSASTWEKKTVTIPGDTSGTWLTSSSLGINVMFSLDSGTNFDTTANEWVAGNKRSISSNVHFVANASATWQITGVQLEANTTATPFEHLQYGQQLALCQRYYEKSYNQSTVPATAQIAGAASSVSSSSAPTQGNGVTFKVTKRAAPTMAIYNGVTGAVGYSYRVSDAASVATTFSHVGEHAAAYINIPSSANGYYFHFTADSEL